MIQESPSFGKIVNNEHTFFNSKIRGLEEDPGVIVRVDSSPKANIGRYTAAERLFDDLQHEYDIRIPKRRIYGEQGYENGKTVYFSLADKVDGLPVLSSKFSKDQIAKMFPKLDYTFANITKYFADIYTYGGAYLNDLKARQFMYGKTKDDEEPKIYLVDIDPFFSIYDPSNPRWHGNEHFLGIYLTDFCNEIAYLEVSFDKEMSRTRAGMKELLGQISPNIPHYDIWIKTHIDRFNEPFSEYNASLTNLF